MQEEAKAGPSRSRAFIPPASPAERFREAVPVTAPAERLRENARPLSRERPYRITSARQLPRTARTRLLLPSPWAAPVPRKDDASVEPPSSGPCAVSGSVKPSPSSGSPGLFPPNIVFRIRNRIGRIVKMALCKPKVLHECLQARKERGCGSKGLRQGRLRLGRVEARKGRGGAEARRATARKGTA